MPNYFKISSVGCIASASDFEPITTPTMTIVLPSPTALINNQDSIIKLQEYFEYLLFISFYLFNDGGKYFQ
jgi:hypothetical protein